MDETLNIPPDFDNLDKHAPTLVRVRKQNPFIVPAGYFEELSPFIQSRIFLSQYKKDNPFSVPEGYFETLPGVLESKLFLSSIGKQEQGIPEGYFNELPSLIQSKVFLSELNKENPFAVPANYFDELPARIQERLAAGNRKKRLIVSLFTPKFAAYAAAAVIALLLVVNIILKQHTDEVIDKPVMLSENEKKEVRSNLAYYVDENTLIENYGNEIAKSGEKKTEDQKEIINYIIDQNIDVNDLQ